MNDQPIGIFDSGVGGTSIWKEVVTTLPNENTTYLADSKYAPYGKRSTKEIIELSKKNTEKLIALNCKIIIVACNTATTNAIKILRDTYIDIPFIGIEPAIKPAVLQSKTKKIGVLATKGTLSSKLFHKTSAIYSGTVAIIEVVGEGLVELIEQGAINTPEMYSLLSSYMTPLIEADIDYLVLGCSHYPYLIPILHKIVPSHIQIIDSGLAVAKQTKTVMTDKKILNLSNVKGSHNFFSNSSLFTLDFILKKSKIPATTAFLDF